MLFGNQPGLAVQNEGSAFFCSLQKGSGSSTYRVEVLSQRRASKQAPLKRELGYMACTIPLVGHDGHYAPTLYFSYYWSAGLKGIGTNPALQRSWHFYLWSAGLKGKGEKDDAADRRRDYRWRASRACSELLPHATGANTCGARTGSRCRDMAEPALGFVHAGDAELDDPTARLSLS